MSSSRNSSTSDSENLTENEVSACEESLAETSQHCSNYHYIIEQPNATSIRYLISSPAQGGGGGGGGGGGATTATTTGTSTMGGKENGTGGMMGTMTAASARNVFSNVGLHTLRDTNMLPSVTACGPQFFMDNNYVYKGYPPYMSQPYALNGGVNNKQKHFAPHFQQQDGVKSMKGNQQSVQQPPPQVVSGSNGTEYVSIRYFAPVSQVNPRLMKGEMINQPIKRDSSRPKVTAASPTPNVQFSPNIGLSPTTIDPSFSFNFNSKMYQQQLQNYDFNPYRMLNFDLPLINQQLAAAAAKQQQQQFSGGNNGSEMTKTDTHHTFNRPVSSLWNLAGGSGNSSMNQKFLNEYTDDLKNYGNYFNSGGNQPGRNQSSFLNKFANRNDRKSKTKFGLFVSGILLIAIIIGVSVFLGIMLSKKLTTQNGVAIARSAIIKPNENLAVRNEENSTSLRPITAAESNTTKVNSTPLPPESTSSRESSSTSSSTSTTITSPSTSATTTTASTTNLELTSPLSTSLETSPQAFTRMIAVESKPSVVVTTIESTTQPPPPPSLTTTTTTTTESINVTIITDTPVPSTSEILVTTSTSTSTSTEPVTTSQVPETLPPTPESTITTTTTDSTTTTTTTQQIGSVTSTESIKEDVVDTTSETTITSPSAASSLESTTTIDNSMNTTISSILK